MKTANPPLPGVLLPRQLQEEMRALAKKARACSLAGKECETLALIKLLPGLTMAEWRKQVACGNMEDLDGWFALNLADEDMPGLQQLHYAGEAALRDPATGTLNRKAFLPLFQSEMGRAIRSRGNLSLVLMELARLPELPPLQGDRALLALAAGLLAEAQPQDVTGRLGLTLALLMPETGRFAALALAEKLARRLLQNPDVAHAGLRAAVLERPTASEPLAACDEMLQNGLQTLAETPADATSARQAIRLYSPGDEPEERKTLVHASEKQFLFFGG